MKIFIVTIWFGNTIVYGLLFHRWYEDCTLWMTDKKQRWLVCVCVSSISLAYKLLSDIAVNFLLESKLLF